MTTAGTTPKSARTVGRVRLDDVVSAEDNPRTHLDGIEELAASIAELGQLVPIIVERRDDGRYDLLAGHRRCARNFTPPAFARAAFQQALRT